MPQPANGGAYSLSLGVILLRLSAHLSEPGGSKVRGSIATSSGRIERVRIVLETLPEY